MEGEFCTRNKTSLLKTFSSVLILFLMLPSYAVVNPTNSTPKIGAKYACSLAANETTIQPLRSGNWNNGAIWPNATRPTLNDDVLIPEGMTINPFGNCFAKSITIKGKLIAVKSQENAAWFNISTEYIMVMGPTARFEIGTATQHYQSNQGATITLLGTDPTALIPGTSVHSKAIMVMNGAQLEMHGKPKVSWTQLGATVAAGSNVIALKEAVNWEVGDEIVIASTDFDMNRAETRRITAVNSGSNYTLNAPLNYKHFGELQEYTHGKDTSISWTVDERAEVGLLSQNITIKGDETSADSGYGGHMMCMPGSKMSAENIELYHMGQKGTLGRYPWHWHVLQEGGTGLYLKNSSIHHTFNRAVTIHATNNTLVEGNVAYDNLGHAYFFEDGNEINNVMQYNLGLVTRRPSAEDALLPSDIDKTRNMSGPATFWITHPHNKINFNHAAGSDGSGIWFAPHQNINSEVYDPTLNPNHIPVPKDNWDNNVAHSSTHGLLVGPTVAINDVTQKVNANLDYYLAKAPSDEIIEIKKYILFKNMIGAYLRVGQDTRTSKWEDFVIADNYRGEALTWDGDMNRFLWVGASKNYESIPVDAFAVGGSAGLIHMHTIYDGPTRVKNSHFADVLPEMSLFDQWGANIKYVGHTLTNTTVQENSFHINWRKFEDKPVWENATVVDVDGVFTGLEPFTVMHKSIPILSNANTTFLANSNGAVSSPLNKYCYVEVRPSDEKSGSKRQRTTFTRSDGIIQQDNVLEIEGVSLVPMVNDRYTYKLSYEKSIPAVSSMYFFSMDEGDNVIIGYPAMPTSAVAYQKDLTDNSLSALSLKLNLEELKNTSGTAYAFDGDVLYVKYEAPQGSRFDNLGAIGVIDVCLYGNCEKLDNVDYLDTDGDGMFDHVETALCRDKNTSKDLSFEFNKSAEGFIRNDILNSATSSPISWQIKTEFQRDPYIQRKGLNINGNQLDVIKVRLKSFLAGEFKLFWSNEDGSYNTARSLVANYNTAGVWQELIFDLRDNENWINKNMTALRLDLPEDPTKAYTTFIDYIKGSQDAQPPQLVPFSAVFGERLQRTNVVEACAGESVLFDFLGEFSQDWSFTFYRPDGKIFNGGTNGVNNDQLKLIDLTENSEANGTWNVVYFNPDGCSNTETFVVNVNPIPNLNQYIKVNDSGFTNTNSIMVSPGDSVLFDMLGDFSQDWNFTYTRPDGQVFPGGTNGSDNDQILLEDTLQGTVNEGEWIVTYINPAGCTNTATFNLQIDVTLALNDSLFQNKEIKMYPNPAKEYVLFSGHDFEVNSIIEIYNSAGKLIYKHNVDSVEDQRIDLTSIESGIYFLKFHVDNKFYAEKIVICK